jgi:hypothetical protein
VYEIYILQVWNGRSYFPAIAIADEIRKHNDAEILFIGQRAE